MESLRRAGPVILLSVLLGMAPGQAPGNPGLPSATDGSAWGIPFGWDSETGFLVADGWLPGDFPELNGVDECRDRLLAAWAVEDPAGFEAAFPGSEEALRRAAAAALTILRPSVWVAEWALVRSPAEAALEQAAAFAILQPAAEHAILVRELGYDPVVLPQPAPGGIIPPGS